jgi:hypothetical protein
MIYKFISDEDIYLQIKNDLLADIISDTAERQKRIRKAEASVLKQIRSKAGKWYDMNIVLESISQWNETISYQEAQHVYDEGVFYVALGISTGAKPKDSSLLWKEADPRHELLVMYCVDMILYHMHAAVNPRKIPDIRKTRYDEAKAWLEMVAERNENPDFPEMETDSELIIWGSNPKTDNYF